MMENIELMSFFKNQFGKMDKQFEQIDKRFDQVEARFAEVNGRIDNLERQMEQQFKEVNSRIDNLDSRMDGLEYRMANLDSRMDGLDSRMDGLENRMEQQFEVVYKRLDDIEAAQQKDVMTMLINIHKKVDHFHYDVDYLREKISKHDMDIERLKKQIKV